MIHQGHSRPASAIISLIVKGTDPISCWGGIVPMLSFGFQPVVMAPILVKWSDTSITASVNTTVYLYETLQEVWQVKCAVSAAAAVISFFLLITVLLRIFLSLSSFQEKVQELWGGKVIVSCRLTPRSRHQIWSVIICELTTGVFYGGYNSGQS